MSALKQKYGYWLTQSFSTYVEVLAKDDDDAEEQIYEMVSNGWISALDEEPETSIIFDKVERISEEELTRLEKEIA